MRWFLSVLPCLVPVLLGAHPADISQLRVNVERHQAELRFTFNLFSLGRFVPGMDVNLDKQIDAAELEVALPRLTTYLRSKARVRVNGGPAPLPEPSGFEKIWPDAAAGQPVAEADLPMRHVDVFFRFPAVRVLNDLWLEFDIWQETGPLGSIEATYEQGDLRTQIPFSMGQPDYLYVTGHAVDELFKHPATPTPTGLAAGGAWAMWLACAGLLAAVLIVLLRR